LIPEYKKGEVKMRGMEWKKKGMRSHPILRVEQRISQLLSSPNRHYLKIQGFITAESAEYAEF
jgi:hypothetical protein